MSFTISMPNGKHRARKILQGVRNRTSGEVKQISWHKLAAMVAAQSSIPTDKEIVQMIFNEEGVTFYIEVRSEEE